MADLKARLLPPRPPGAAGPSEGISKRPETLKRPLFQGMEGVSLKKRGHGVRSWIRIDPSGNTQILEYVTELQRRLFMKNRSDIASLKWSQSPVDYTLSGAANGFDVPLLMSSDERKQTLHDGDMFSGSSADDLPFEFQALEVALEAACTFLDAQAIELEQEVYPVLDELTTKISTLNLEHVRRLKSRLVALTRRVKKVRDEIEQLMDDDSDMAEMYLTEKKEQHAEYAFFDQKLGSHLSFNYVGAGGSMSAPVSPVGSPVGSTYHSSVDRRLEKSLSQKSRHDSMSSSRVTGVEELEMLLEAYFVVIDGTLNKLTSLKEYIDDTEDFINIQLDNVRNQLIQFELLLTTATFVLAIYSVVAGVFGMNIPIALFDEPESFKWVLIISGVGGFLIFIAFLWFFKQKRLMPL
uniref:Magnesium transporter n=1 Tax=Physcomitrium patens TaxID=3218 RepID=A0A7I4CIY3_PHYPA